jgi:hypothetical protein
MDMDKVAQIAKQVNRQFLKEDALDRRRGSSIIENDFHYQ